MQDLRIDFQFSNAAFEFKSLPFKIPYPVPFKLLGDETKVWQRSCICYQAACIVLKSYFCIFCFSGFSSFGLL